MASSSLTTWLVHCSPALLSLNLPARRSGFFEGADVIIRDGVHNVYAVARGADDAPQAVFS